MSLLATLVMSTFVAGEERVPVSFLPQWIPQAQFAGYMMALEKGFYREAGLDVTLLRGGPGNPPFEALQAGRATFCTHWLTRGIQRRAKGLAVVNLSQIVQRSAMVLVARKTSGISSIGSLNGKSVGLWEGDFQIPALAIFRKHGVTVTVVPMYSTVNLFLKGGVDVVGAMWYNEYHTILNSGLNPDELTLLFLADLGLNVPEDGIYCMEETFQKDPGLCHRFVQATLRGWTYAIEHLDETLNVVMNHADAAHTGTNRAHQRWMLQRMKDLIAPAGDMSRLGNLKREDYDNACHALKELNLIGECPAFTDFYRGRP